MFQDAGIAAERIPLSGSAGGSFAGDLTIPVMGVDRRFEAKKRAGGFKLLYDFLADHFGLFVAQDRAPTLVVLRADHFIDLVKAAERGRSLAPLASPQEKAHAA
jgi:hypothetical protein